ncbi:hypothetical protein OAO87_04145 [bacterium]|nr:hypothetical protein [bacterium]
MEKPAFLSYERLHHNRSEVGLERDDINKQIKCMAAIAAVDGLSELEKTWIKTCILRSGAKPRLSALAVANCVFVPHSGQMQCTAGRQ